MPNPVILRVIAVVLLLGPFCFLATIYGSLPHEIPVIRSFAGHSALFASKSLFAVFRVPLMNLIHGLAALVMLSRTPGFTNPERRRAYYGLFSTLLLTVGLKSALEALEFQALTSTSLARYSKALAIGTFATVIIGITLALWRGRRARLPWLELRLGRGNIALLLTFLALYGAIVAFTFLISHRGSPNLLLTRL